MTNANSLYVWQMLDNLAREICNDAKNTIVYEPECKLAFLSVYDELKEEYSKIKTSELPIHRHEDAACLVAAVQRIKPLKTINNNEVIDGALPKYLSQYPNELLAIFAALSVIKKQIRIIFEHEENNERLYCYGKNKIESFLNAGFRFPSTCCIAHENYVIWLAKAISMGSPDKYMLYSIANILFLLEAYNFKLNTNETIDGNK
ncbi:MAG: hypothetical protein FWC71_10655 [Defluviitaleaceae bacterium]|nr:hypothetical protein [Defluviitaleaceae bacterium]